MAHGRGSLVKAKKCCSKAGKVLKTKGTRKSGKVLAHCRWQKPGEKVVQARRAKEMPRNADGKFKSVMSRGKYVLARPEARKSTRKRKKPQRAEGVRAHLPRCLSRPVARVAGPQGICYREAQGRRGRDASGVRPTRWWHSCKAMRTANREKEK